VPLDPPEVGSGLEPLDPPEVGSGLGLAAGTPVRGPQSVQSVPSEHELYSEPGPPSSQSPSDAQLHDSVQMVPGSGGGVGGAGGGAGGEAMSFVQVQPVQSHPNWTVRSAHV